MLRFMNMLIGIALLLPTAVTGQSDDDIPPPLAYANWNDIQVTYYIHDFASGEITSVTSEGDLYPEFGGEQFLPQEIMLQSPHDAGLQMHFIAEGESPESDLYTLYVVANGEGEAIAEHTFPVSPLEWSSDGRYFYFETYEQVEGSAWGNYMLQQYDLRAGGMPRTLLEYIGLTRCSPLQAWCLIQQQNRGDEFDELKLHLLDTNTGGLTLLDVTSSISFYWVWWQTDAPTFLYSAKVSEGRNALRLYNYDTHSETLIAEVEGAYITQVIPSPDDRWLVVTTTTDLYVIDQTVENPAPLLVTGDVDLLVTIRYVRWLDDDRLFFDALGGGERRYGYYTATVTDGIISAVELIPMGELLDDDWSPDGRWLALSFGDYGENNNAYVIDAFGQVPVYQLQADFAPRDMICIDWYDPEQYQTDITSLCDIYMGIG